jgi:hypothetical protein
MASGMRRALSALSFLFFSQSHHYGIETHRENERDAEIL